jgi:4-amino-4-deoxy-L-arabinose transferase-like glycosyltransferase
MLVLGLFALALFVVRLTGLPNLFDNECRLGESVLDVVQNGNWLCPHDALGHTDKPPLLTWLSALAALATGRVDRFTLYLPSALATTVLAGLVLAAGRRHFGWWAGFLGGLAYLASEVAAKQVATARWDALFALTVALAALAAFHGWTTGRGWVWFWLAGAAATLTKGPLGVLLAGAGLGAAWWERASGTPRPVRGRQAGGIALYLALTLGWFLLAWRQEGSALVENMLGRELLGHAIEHAPGRHFTKPLEDFFGNFAPWSAAAALALGRSLLRPAADARERRFERFLACWLVGGLFVFCLAPHTAARLILPVVPAAALLAGRELDRLTRGLPRAAVASLAAATAALTLALAVVYYHSLERRAPDVERTLAVERLAADVRAAVGDGFPLTVVDAPCALGLLLGTRAAPAPADAAARLLAGEAAAYVAVVDAARLRAALDSSTRTYDVGGCTTGDGPYVRLVGNRPRLAWAERMALVLGRTQVELDRARLVHGDARQLVFAAGSAGGSVVLTNLGAHRTVLDVRANASEPWHERTLAAGETWRLVLPQSAALPAGAHDRVERHHQVPLVGMIGKDVDGALDGPLGQAIPEREREQVLAPILDRVELVADHVARRVHAGDAQRTDPPIADVYLPLGRVAPMRDAKGDLRWQDDDIALDAPEDGHGEVGRALARRVEDELVVEPPERQVGIERHDDALAAAARERLERGMQRGVRVLDPGHPGGRAGSTGHDRDLAPRRRPLAHAPEVERRGRGDEVGDHLPGERELGGRRRGVVRVDGDRLGHPSAQPRRVEANGDRARPAHRHLASRGEPDRAPTRPLDVFDAQRRVAGVLQPEGLLDDRAALDAAEIMCRRWEHEPRRARRPGGGREPERRRAQ